MASQVVEAAFALLSPHSQPDQRSAADKFLRTVSGSAEGVEEALTLLQCQQAQQTTLGTSGEDVQLLACALLRAALRVKTK